MGYYNLELYPISKKIFTIVTLWVKCEYQKLLTGVCNIPNIFQENIPELLEGFDMVQAYIDNILVITKDNFVDHLKDTVFFYRNSQKRD